MRSTTSFEFGEIVLVPFPFTNQKQSKQRPAVVTNNAAYSQRHQDLIVVAITSRVRLPVRTDEFLAEDWQQAGLLKLSAFKPLISSLEKSAVVRKLGSLSSRDQATLVRMLQATLGPP